MTTVPVSASSSSSVAPQSAPPFVVPMQPAKSQHDFDRIRNLKRRENIQIGRMLYDGKWRELLIDLHKLSQFDYRKVKDHANRINALVVKVNLYRLAVITHADVMFSDSPVISIPDGFTQAEERWELIADDSQFEAVLHEAVATANMEHEGWIQIVVEDGETCIVTRDSFECFPVGPVGPGGQPKIADRRWPIRVKEEGSGKERFFLRVERHSAPGGIGTIENFAIEVKTPFDYEVPPTAPKIDLKLILGDEAPEPVIQTGADRPLLFRFAVRVLRREPQPDVSKSDVDLIDWLAATTSQLSRIVAKHADPKLRLPPGIADENGVVDAKKLEAFTDPDGNAGYLTWDAKIDQVLGLLEKIVNWQLIVLEISPSLLGIKAGAAPESFEKLFLESANTMKRANRCATTWQPLIERIITTALMVDSALVSKTGYPVERVSARLRPGLPRTEGEINRELAEMNQTGQLSQISMLEEIHGTERAKEEMERIAAEQRARASQFMPERYLDPPASPPPASDTPTEPEPEPEPEGEREEATA